MIEPFFVLTALMCRNCHEVIYSRHTLTDSVCRPALVAGATAAGAVQSGNDWFCSRKCRTDFQLHIGVVTTKSAIPDLD